MAMKDRVIRSAEVPNVGSCKVMCYMEPDCVSINVGPVEGGNQKCELNNILVVRLILLGNSGDSCFASRYAIHH